VGRAPSPARSDEGARPLPSQQGHRIGVAECNGDVSNNCRNGCTLGPSVIASTQMPPKYSTFALWLLTFVFFFWHSCGL
jgi:hypothetical protein